MNLSKRLSKVLEYINEFDKVADIGADHGYLSIAMLEKGIKFVQVVENKTEPFLRAQSALSGYDNVIFSLSDGISDLNEDINTVTICGMGGLNIVEILGSQLNKAKKLNYECYYINIQSLMKKDSMLLLSYLEEKNLLK